MITRADLKEHFARCKAERQKDYADQDRRREAFATQLLASHGPQAPVGIDRSALFQPVGRP